MIKLTVLDIGFTEPVGEAVLAELPGQVHPCSEGKFASLDYPADIAPSMVLRDLANWIDEHQIKVDEVTLEVPSMSFDQAAPADAGPEAAP